MQDYLKHYQEYYRLRMLRYEGNQDYINSYNSEKAIYEAILSCTTLEEFKTKLGNLNEKNAIALVIDQYTIRLRHYEAMQETIKADSCKKILEKIKTVNNVSGLMALVQEEEKNLMQNMTADAIQPFDDFLYLENLQIWNEADVPEKYKASYKRYADAEKVAMKERYQQQAKAIRDFVPDWTFSFNRVHESRHRRLLPYPDEVIQQNILLTEQILK